MLEMLFRQRIRLSDGTIARVATYADGYGLGAQTYRVEVIHDEGAGLTRSHSAIFPLAGVASILWGAHSPMWTSDGRDAKRATLNHLALKPGDTDAAFFDGYTADQLDFVKTYGEEISMIAYSRYGEG